MYISPFPKFSSLILPISQLTVLLITGDDSSMELTMSQHDDPTPWAHPPPQLPLNSPSSSTIPPPQLLRGRGYFYHLGTLRTKPGYSDSPLTLSKSCSDKLSSRTYLSLLLTPTTYLITPQVPQAYISTLTIPKTEFSEVGCARVFGCEYGGRLSPLLCKRSKNLVGADDSAYNFNPFKLQTTSVFPILSSARHTSRSATTSAE